MSNKDVTTVGLKRPAKMYMKEGNAMILIYTRIVTILADVVSIAIKKQYQLS